MVEIVDDGARERARMETQIRIFRLQGIAERLLGKNIRYNDEQDTETKWDSSLNGYLRICLNNPPLSIHVHTNCDGIAGEISITSSSLFDTALRLASAYEQGENRPWRLRKDYA